MSDFANKLMKVLCEEFNIYCTYFSADVRTVSTKKYLLAGTNSAWSHFFNNGEKTED